ncbi:MAG TPA: biotin/lipoyl-containing protein, partial [Thermoplasmata archaeon]|nr:biotin/lipoyl-containing protein [Thermoplasmata archaeon]
LDEGTITIAGRSFPFRVASEKGVRIELEIDGNPIVVEGWPSGVTPAPASLAVDGETRATNLSVDTGGPTPRAARTAPHAPTGARSPSEPTRDTLPPGRGDVLPPMPGRVVEVRVKAGDRVVAGQVLLVLEAMKMRNEVAASLAGRVVEVTVQPGSNVRAREPMIRIDPES